MVHCSPWFTSYQRAAISRKSCCKPCVHSFYHHCLIYDKASLHYCVLCCCFLHHAKARSPWRVSFSVSSDSVQGHFQKMSTRRRVIILASSAKPAPSHFLANSSPFPTLSHSRHKAASCVCHSLSLIPESSNAAPSQTLNHNGLREVLASYQGDNIPLPFPHPPTLSLVAMSLSSTLERCWIVVSNICFLNKTYNQNCLTTSGFKCQRPTCCVPIHHLNMCIICQRKAFK